MKFYTSVAKGLKLKARKIWGLIHTFEEVTGEKLVGMGFFCPAAPSWIGLNVEKNIKTMKLQGCLVRRSRGNIWIRDLHSKPWENTSHKIYHRSYHLDCKRLDFQCSYILDELYFSMFIWHLTKTTRYFFRKNQFKRNLVIGQPKIKNLLKLQKKLVSVD